MVALETALKPTIAEDRTRAFRHRFQIEIVFSSIGFQPVCFVATITPKLKPNRLKPVLLAPLLFRSQKAGFRSN